MFVFIFISIMSIINIFVNSTFNITITIIVWHCTKNEVFHQGFLQ